MTRATRAIAFAVCTVMLAPTLGSAQQIVGKGVEFTTPESIKWVKNAAGTQETRRAVRRSRRSPGPT